MNKQPAMTSGSSSVPTMRDDPLLRNVKPREKSVTISKDDWAKDSASKPKTRDDSADQGVHTKQRSSAQSDESGKDLEDRGYHEFPPFKGTGEGGTGADDNLSSSSETQSTLEPPQDAGPGTSTSDAPRTLEENGREELVDPQKKLIEMMEDLQQKQMETMDLQQKQMETMDLQKKQMMDLQQKQMETMDLQKKQMMDLHQKQMETMDLTKQLTDTIHNSRTSSSVMQLTEDPAYRASIAPGRTGEGGEVGCLDNPLASPILQEAGTSTSATHDGTTTATVDEGTSIQSQSSAQTLSSNNRPMTDDKNASPVMAVAEDPVYPAASNAPDRVRRMCKPFVHPPSPASLQKEDTGTSTSTSAMADDENASGEHLNDPVDAVQAGPVSGASDVSKKEKVAKVIVWMVMMWISLTMKCQKLLTLIKVYKTMSVVSGGILYLCLWIPFDIVKGVKGLIPLSFVLWLWYLLLNGLENEHLQGFMKEFNNFWLMEFFLERLFWDIIPYIKDQENVADATENPLLYHALVYSLLPVILLILKKNNHITCTTNVCFAILLIFWVS